MDWWPKPEWRSLNPRLEKLLLDELIAWEGTPYLEGSQTAQAGVDCVHFVCAMADHMNGGRYKRLRRVPADQSLHCRAEAFKALRLLMRTYGARSIEEGEPLEPGDVLVVGPEKGGPGHAQILSPMPYVSFHCTRPHVSRAAWGPYTTGMKLYSVLRVPKDRWRLA